MIDLRWVREQPEQFDAALVRRGAMPASHLVLEADQRRRAIETKLQEEQAERNRLSREIGELKRGGQDATAPMAAVAALRQRVQDGEEELRVAQLALDELLASFPNPLDSDVPDGADEGANRLERSWGELPAFDFEPRSHDDLGRALGFDPESAARLSGARFAVLRGGLARLHRALGQFMIDLQVADNGYEEVDAPYLVRDQVLFGTGQLPKFGADLFRTEAGLWLIPTSEVTLANLVSGQSLEESQLPLRFTALTPCFRSEAGAAGRDTKGLIRLHQFMKVELVSITRPEESGAEHARMTACAEAVLQRLELPYRVMLLSAGDTGFGARKTFDIEVWLPGQGTYREISSCSNCGDFQARRMNARYRPKDERGLRYVHTLNGSGLAVGRTLVAVLENYQQADGSIVVPTALRPYMDGLDRLQPNG